MWRAEDERLSLLEDILVISIRGILIKKIVAWLLSLLMMLCFCAVAQTDGEALPFDLEGYFPTGVCLAQVQPLATWEEAVAAGLPLPSEPYATANSRADDAKSPLNRQCSLWPCPAERLGFAPVAPFRRAG